MRYRTSPILRYGLSYLSSILLGPCVFLCTFMLMVSISTLVDRNRSLEQALLRFLANFPFFDQRVSSHHFGKEEITHIGWILWGLLGMVIEGAKRILIRILPFAFPSSYKVRLAIGSALVGGTLALGVTIIDYDSRATGVDQKPFLMFLVAFLFSWVSLALGLAVQSLSDKVSEEIE